MLRRLALFDLDNTLLAGDSDHAWGEFLISKGYADEATHRSRNDAFFRDYEQGYLDIHAYVAFTVAPLIRLSAAKRNSLLAEFVAEVVRPMIGAAARQLVARHREQGDYCAIITATNDFVTTPIAREFAVDALLATELEQSGGHFTGKILGIPCFQSGKVSKLEQWLQSAQFEFKLADSVFYSDSINDLPLLERVAEPVVVDPDSRLLRTAEERGWRTISLRE